MMNKQIPIVLVSLIMGVSTAFYVGYERGKRSCRDEIVINYVKMNMNHFLHLYEAEKLASQVDTNFPKRAVICLYGSLSAYADMKNKWDSKGKELSNNRGFEQDLKKAISVVQGQKLVSLSGHKATSATNGAPALISADFSYLLR